MGKCGATVLELDVEKRPTPGPKDPEGAAVPVKGGGLGAALNSGDPPSPLSVFPKMALAVAPNENGLDADEEPAEVHISATADATLKEGTRRETRQQTQ